MIGEDPKVEITAHSCDGVHRAVADVDYAEALSMLAEGRTHAERHGFAAQRANLLTFRLVAEREGGRLAEAARTAELVIRSPEQMPDPASVVAAGFHPGLLLSMALANRGRLWFLLGRLDDAQRELEAAVDALGGSGVVWHWFLVDLARVRGDVASATRAARNALERGVADSTHDQRIMAVAAAGMHVVTGAWREAAAACERVLSSGYGWLTQHCSEHEPMLKYTRWIASRAPIESSPPLRM